jgi:hypothetical protein
MLGCIAKAFNMGNSEMNNIVLPYGVNDIKPTKDLDHCCPIKGCDTRIDEYPSMEKPRNSYCQKHKIYCRRNTYIYEEKVDNLIIDKELFENVFEKQNNGKYDREKKYDTKKMGHENSEDALTWNVFVTLQKAGGLKAVASLISDKSCEEELELILWGYSLKDGLLIKELKSFREKFESQIGVPTEPDIILKTANEVFLIEAKFCSSNSRKDISVWRDKEIDGRTKKEYDSYKIRYGGLIDEVLNKDIIERQNKFCSQLVRYALYANYAYKDKSYYIVNLLPKMHKEISLIKEEFKPYLKKNNFKTITWEDIYEALENLKGEPEIIVLRKYLQEKTANLKKAFTI